MRTAACPSGFLMRSGEDGSRLFVRDSYRGLFGEAAVEEIRRRLPSAPVLATSGRGKVRRLDLPGGFALAARPYRHGGLAGKVLGGRAIGAGRALSELLASERARARGVPTPEIAGIYLPGRGVRAPVLLTALVPGGKPLPELLREPWSVRRPALHGLGETVARIFAVGLRHPDLNLANFLYAPGPPPRVVVLDLDRARLGPALTLAAKTAMLRRMARSWRKHAAAGSPLRARDGLAFLRALFARDPQLAANRLRLVRALRRPFPVHALGWKLGAAQARRDRAAATAGGSTGAAASKGRHGSS